MSKDNSYFSKTTTHIKRTNEILELVLPDVVHIPHPTAVETFRVFCHVYEEMMTESEVSFVEMLMKIVHLQSLYTSICAHNYSITFTRN